MKKLLLFAVLLFSLTSQAQFTWTVKCQDARNSDLQTFYPIFEYSYTQGRPGGILWKDDVIQFQGQNQSRPELQHLRVGIEVNKPMWIDNMMIIETKFGFPGGPGEGIVSIRTRGPGVGNSQLLIRAIVNDFRYAPNSFANFSCVQAQSR